MSPLVILAFLVFSSCAAVGNKQRGSEATSSSAPQPDVIHTIQPGDSDLTCKDLISQMEQMDNILSSSGEGANQTVTKTVAGIAAQQAIGFIPLVGPALAGLTGVVTSVFGKGGQQQLQQQNTMILAQQRKQRLLTLYGEKKCSETPSRP